MSLIMSLITKALSDAINYIKSRENLIIKGESNKLLNFKNIH